MLMTHLVRLVARPRLQICYRPDSIRGVAGIYGRIDQGHRRGMRMVLHDCMQPYQSVSLLRIRPSDTYSYANLVSYFRQRLSAASVNVLTASQTLAPMTSGRSFSSSSGVFPAPIPDLCSTGRQRCISMSTLLISSDRIYDSR
jgi:hypothetical protein